MNESRLSCLYLYDSSEQRSQIGALKLVQPMSDDTFLRQLNGFSLTTAEILYRMPDHPGLLQLFVWQDYDIHPRFPKLKGFLEFWTRNLEGPLHRVRVVHRGLISPTEFNFIDGMLLMH